MKKTATQRAAALTEKKAAAKSKKTKKKRMGPTTRAKLLQKAAELAGTLAAYENERLLHMGRAKECAKRIEDAEALQHRSSEEVARLDSQMQGVRIQLGKLNVQLGKK